ncbi:hypothetical protein HQ531_03280 [bacterium]|nr:hypothetical protein [bacterium]
MNNSVSEKRGCYYQFFQRKYPAWLYSVAMVLFALSLYIWIKFFLVVQV